MITKEKSWVTPRDNAAKAPIIAQVMGASSSILGKGRAVINRMPNVKIVVGQGRPKLGAAG